MAALVTEEEVVGSPAAEGDSPSHSTEPAPSLDEYVNGENERAVRAALWTTTAQRQSAWVAEDRATREALADPVAYPIKSPRRYEPSPQLWQSEGWSWERQQARPLTGEATSSPERLPGSCTSRFRATGALPGYSGYLSVDTGYQFQTPRDTMHAQSSYQPFTPGYTGFVPASLNNVDAAAYPRSAAPTETSVAATHRHIIAAGTPRGDHTRTGVLSKQVTIYSPFNPYNLVGVSPAPLPPTKLESLRRTPF
eukprot:m.228019 g.228019  ORF g.228019 m.228019 type:complete len:252 (+) comp17381_c0_seq1:2-757(+)